MRKGKLSKNIYMIFDNAEKGVCIDEEKFKEYGGCIGFKGDEVTWNEEEKGWDWECGFWEEGSEWVEEIKE